VLGKDSEYFQELQTHTGWGRTLYGFAVWCLPQPGWLTLDIGCGPGLLPAIFAKFGCTALGVDIDMDMFNPSPLHAAVVVADVMDLPIRPNAFDLITASNLVFLLPQPEQALLKIRHLLHPGGKFAMLNPSENLNPQSAAEFIIDKGLEGITCDTLLNWAKRAIENHRWTEAQTRVLYTKAGFKFEGSVLKVGPGFGRFSSGITRL
jgi:SAM-dependent methyltransferase